MKGGGARARLDGLESHCKWGNRIAPTQWTKIEALLAGLTVASREPDRSHPAMHPAFRCMPRGLRGSAPVATERDRTRSQIARQGPCAGQTRAHAQARPVHDASDRSGPFDAVLLGEQPVRSVIGTGIL